jgi:hypothetical protein
MITRDNYFRHIDRIGFEQLPEELKKAHLVIADKTDNGKDWSSYDKEKDFHQLADASLDKLKELIESQFLNGLGEVPEKDIKAARKKHPFAYRWAEFNTFKRAIELHGKVVNREDLAYFIKALQEDIRDKRITSQSPAANEIKELQYFVIEKYNLRKAAVLFFMPEDMVFRLKELTAKIWDDHINATEKVKTNPADIDTSIDLKGAPTPTIVPSNDMAKMHFNTLGFKDKWLSFIGDPCKGFTAMVFGMPKTGKSYLCIEFANYLSLNHGKVLYVSKEEFMSPTFVSKLKDINAAHTNLDIAGALPEDLSSYDFVFLDSVSSMKLSVEDLKELKKKYPATSFIYIFHVTKNGKARGTNEFMHNVDIVIELPEKGKALQFGRFNQGGAMNIFPTNQDVNGGLKISSANAENETNESDLSSIERDKTAELVEQVQIQIKKLKDIVTTVYKNGNPETKDLENIHSWLDEKLEYYKAYQKRLKTDKNTD